MTRRLFSFLLAAAVLVPAVLAQDLGTTFTIRAERLYVGDGKVIEPGFVRVEAGKIVAVGPATDSTRSDAFGMETLVLTPGFVEGSSTAGLPRGLSENEESNEITPCVRAC